MRIAIYLLVCFLTIGIITAASKVNKTKPDHDKHRLKNICKNVGTMTPKQLKFAELVYEYAGYNIKQMQSAQHQALCWMMQSDEMKLRGANTFLLERYALVSFYASTNGPHGNSWILKDKWLSKHSHCKWYGIQCYMNGRVKAVDLSFNGLSGELPQEMFNVLSELKSLKLYTNELQSHIPQSLFKLKKLQYLQLQVNAFEGTVPGDVGSMKSLKEMYLYGNNLKGYLPDSLSKLTKLRVLDLYSNNFQGDVNVKTLEKMSSLQELYLDDNDLTGRIGKDSAICKRKKLAEFSSDCRGTSPEVSCDCCTTCCHDKQDPKCVEMKRK